MAEPDYLDGDCEELIKPKKLINPVKTSRNHQDMHRELLMNQKRSGETEKSTFSSAQWPLFMFVLSFLGYLLFYNLRFLLWFMEHKQTRMVADKDCKITIGMIRERQAQFIDVPLMTTVYSFIVDKSPLLSNNFSFVKFTWGNSFRFFPVQNKSDTGKQHRQCPDPG